MNRNNKEIRVSFPLKTHYIFQMNSLVYSVNFLHLSIKIWFGNNVFSKSFSWFSFPITFYNKSIYLKIVSGAQMDAYISNLSTLMREFSKILSLLHFDILFQLHFVMFSSEGLINGNISLSFLLSSLEFWMGIWRGTFKSAKIRGVVA